ncbi:phosphoadenosine phosphosulfate reductase family protein [Acinetobacter baumannii]|uniref:Phosphoadenosine phosphosulfate reductase family protein n=4 Tax=Acinetobacter baumannii TaxID=470 RepID=A0A4V0P7I8_ACIBA|nr:MULTISPECIES: phosphoadenosine phosphosulfate reductase family protein [Acinetobacter]ADX92187.2 3'-phosphoadenosine 5'-phosphosulfate sulfotransferase (PAPS reductase)/FAD synthetase [Acinetobacter baumannii TCDC-AB0715]ACC58068.1 3'-phosphoadenosine 5'-phosphosulfate sulfotransferase (PAPS reductase)/FAD synthetase [Acinetobacter baumannii ACICU]ADX93210.2 3'-phosphoadenosine 5'-phosphosulfate sulfotransferase (PAPS reductase)/FAD synthetase [Acinetobacter baumannii TCDC-AB0715]AFI94583.1 
MKKVISFSGGRTSGYAVNLFKNDPDAYFIFMDTGAEHPATYQFIKDIVKHWKINLVCLRVVVNPQMKKGVGYKIIPLDELKQDLEPWRDMLKKYGSPYYDMPFCTARMKTEPFEKYCNDVFGKNNYERWIGIRSDEPKRLPIEVLEKLGLPIHKDAKKQKAGFRYLAEISDFTKEDVLDWWEQQPFDLAITEHLGNCVFCIKKHLNKVALAAKDEPEQAVKWIAVTEGENVRSEGRKYNHHRMYRTRLHLSDVIEAFKNHDRDELYNALRSSKRYETGSCTESCEAII